MIPKPVFSYDSAFLPFGTMLNRMVPKRSWIERAGTYPFGTMLNRMVPKPRIIYLT